MNQKTISALEILARISVVFLLIGTMISIEQQDLRHIATGISLFGIFFICFFAYPKEGWGIFFQSNNSAPEKIIYFISTIIIIAVGFSFFLYGVSLFLHHYDYDTVFNFLRQRGLV